ETALALAEELFWERPNLTQYQELQNIAKSLDNWPALHETILTRLSQEGKTNLLIQIHLEEGDVGSALLTLGSRAASRQAERYYAYGPSMRLQVARAAEPDYPREAIDLYLQAVDSLVAQRGRGNYATAATYLQRVRGIYRRLNEEERWQKLIATLREEYRRLPACQDEFNKAGL
ncbi:MAG: glyoxalase, partial [Chloroflexota bacterium]|nr:glyoxalase [Chloroflexota bacterium]